jgi:hypothetical protein
MRQYRCGHAEFETSNAPATEATGQLRQRLARCPEIPKTIHSKVAGSSLCQPTPVCTHLASVVRQHLSRGSFGR